jgi:electron transport complex protein RnfC
MKGMRIMSLLLGSMRKHIPGKKSLTDHVDAKTVMPQKSAYIPLVTGANTNYEIKVSEGDHVNIGSLLAVPKTGFYVPIYSSVSGTYTGTVKRAHNSLRPQLHMVIDLDEEQVSQKAFEPMDWQKASREELVEFVKNSGIIGQGGAGFPTYVKYTKPEGIDCVIINAVECEPYITADYKMILDYPAQLVEGARILKKMANAPVVYVGIKESHPDLINTVDEEIKNQNVSSEIQVKAVPDVYPMGWEKVLVREILHKEYNGLPSEAGAIINNATTAICVARAFKEGAAIEKKYVTFSGEGLKHPCNIIAPVGTPVNEIIESIGGYTTDSVRLIAGGPMMGKTMVKDEFVIDRAMNAITVLDNSEDDAIACLRCGRCSDHCPAGLQPVRIAAAVKENNVEEMEKRGALSCIECGLCTYVCPSHILVTENVRKAKRTLMMKKKK